MNPFVLAAIVIVLGVAALFVFGRRRSDSTGGDRRGGPPSVYGGQSSDRSIGPVRREVLLNDGTVVNFRLATAQDAQRVAELANALDREVGDGTEPHTAESVCQGMLSGAAGLALWVAVPNVENADALEPEPVAYALVQDMYDTDSAEWATWLHDLYVMAVWRDRELGAYLMAHLAETTRAAGHSGLWWGVHRNNTRAQRFYRSLDAHQAPIHVMGVAGPTLNALANKARRPR